jgi:ubiquinone/menaquinone biosynthesis C-methylase UbiE
MKNGKKQLWKGISNNFNKFLSPSRPSNDDLSNYTKLIKQSVLNKTNPKIMLMGSTLELRRLLYLANFLYDAEIYCLDVNQNMYKAMKDSLVKSDKYKEIYFKRSWLDTKFPDKTFDLIIGDEVVYNVNSKLHKSLFAEINRILKKDGKWIMRHDLYKDDVKKKDLAGILIEVAERVEKGRDDFQQAINTLAASLFVYFGWKNHYNNNLNTHLREMKKIYKNKLKNHKLNKIIKELIILYEDNFVSLGGDYKWYVLSEEDSDEELKRYFDIKGKYYAKDYPTCEFSPIYYLRKK